MKRAIIFTCIVLGIVSCRHEYRWVDIGQLNSLRVDDDGEYHINSDNFTESDILQHSIVIVRHKGAGNRLYKQEKRDCYKKSCDIWNQTWTYKVAIEPNFNIMTFDD